MFLETSARTAYNVEEAFNLSAQNILSNIEKNKMSVEDTVKTKNLKIIINLTMQKSSGMKLSANKTTKKEGAGACC